MNNYTEPWQHKFGEMFMIQMQTVLKCSITSEDEAFQKFLDLKRHEKKNFWVKMAEILRVKPKAAHDFFHNTWSRRYCSDFTQYKPEAKLIIDELDQSLSKKEQFSTLYSILQQRHPDILFHYQTVYQYFNYISRKNANYSESVERSCSNLSTLSTLSNSSIKSFSSIIGDDIRQPVTAPQKQSSKLYQVVHQNDDDDESDQTGTVTDSVPSEQPKRGPNQQQVIHDFIQHKVIEERKHPQQGHIKMPSEHNSFEDLEYIFDDFIFYDTT